MMWFRKLTLEEQISRVKAEAKSRCISCPSVNVGYMAVAIDLGYNEAAEHFMREMIREKIEQLT